jgi:hypothetical protein
VSTKYAVTFAEFTTRHYIKKFVKQHGEQRWKLTSNAIRALVANADEVILGDKLETIVHKNNLKIAKLNFAIAGTGLSPKGSGCRAIVLIDTNQRTVEIMLVYHKSFIVKQGNETVAWKRIIKDNFPNCKHLIIEI